MDNTNNQNQNSDNIKDDTYLYDGQSFNNIQEFTEAEIEQLYRRRDRDYYDYYDYYRRYYRSYPPFPPIPPFFPIPFLFGFPFRGRRRDR